jgi:NDP-hexose 2,3-enoyl reductase
MQYTHLGRTGLQVSRLCLGTMNFGPQTPEAESHALMDRALEHGINFFDTADVYGRRPGEGVTEQIIGRWFTQGGGRREKVVLAITSTLG